MGSCCTVSVVVAIYNSEKYLDKCIQSVLNQTFQNFELVLVNDGSFDSSEKIIDKYVEQNPGKVKKINKENGGLSSARNASFGSVCGKYITFLDSDDYYDENYLKNLCEKAEKDNLDVVCSGQYKITESGEIKKTIKYRIKDGKCYQRRLNISGKLYRTEYIKKWDIYFPVGKTYEDNSFNLQAFFLSSKIGFLEYAGYYQVIHEGSITSKPIEASRLPFDEWERVSKKIKNINDAEIDTEFFDFVLMSFLTYFLIVRNRKREYLSNENNNEDLMTDNLGIIIDSIQRIVDETVFDYSKNKYVRIFSYPDLSFVQKVGTRIFYSYAKKNQLRKLVRIAYKLL